MTPNANSIAPSKFTFIQSFEPMILMSASAADIEPAVDEVVFIEADFFLMEATDLTIDSSDLQVLDFASESDTPAQMSEPTDAIADTIAIDDKPVAVEEISFDEVTAEFIDEPMMMEFTSSPDPMLGDIPEPVLADEPAAVVESESIPELTEVDTNLLSVDAAVESTTADEPSNEILQSFLTVIDTNDILVPDLVVATDATGEEVPSESVLNDSSVIEDGPSEVILVDLVPVNPDTTEQLPVAMETTTVIPDEPAPTVAGTSRNDLIISTQPNAFLRGEAGHDILIGLGGDNVIKGDSGHDMMFVVRGNNIIDGGAGHDTAVFWGISRSAVTITDRGFGLVEVNRGDAVDI